MTLPCKYCFLNYFFIIYYGVLVPVLAEVIGDMTQPRAFAEYLHATGADPRILEKGFNFAEGIGFDLFASIF